MSLLDNFGFYKSDRIAIAIFAAIALCCAVAMYYGGNVGNDIFVSGDNAAGDGKSSADAISVRQGAADTYYVEGREIRLFPFDPNTADSTQLLSLGLQPWMVRNIYKYRAAGGVYRKPSDFARLYGLTAKQYRMLEPYIRISVDYMPASDFYSDEAEREIRGSSSSEVLARDTLMYPYKLRKGEAIQVNSADTTQLKKIPGIGSSYARAVVRWREKLGGFYSASQLREIDGFPEEAMSYVRVDASAVRRLRINELTYSQLRQHPYINFYQARDIVDFRRIHGQLKSISQLELMESFTADDIARLRHYLEF